MHQQSMDPAAEVKRLQHCMNDLVSVLALPAVWIGREPGRILDTFRDALLAMLDLDFVYTRVRLDPHEAPIDALTTSRLYGSSHWREEIRHELNQWSGDVPQRWPEQALTDIGKLEISVFSIRMGIEAELGLIVAGSRRPGFPEQTERLVLSVAANQAAIGLQQAQHLNEQKRIANELDRRVAERTQELAEINDELQLQVGLLQHIPVSAWTLKPDGTPDFVNRVWLEFSGQTLEFVRSHPEAWMKAVHPEDREIASKALWDGVCSGRGFAFETRSLRAQDAVYRWHLQQAVVMRDAEGKVLKFVGTTTDIDDQKRAEEALRTSESNLRRVIDTIPTLCWCNLADGPNEFLSKSWHQYTGLSPEEARGWGWSAAFHPDDLPPLMKRWQELLVSGETGEIEARLRRHDGVYRWFLIRVAPFRDETGTIIRWYGTSTDIEDRKRAEETVLANERNLGLIINTMPVLAWSALPDGSIDFFNQRWLDYTGLSAEDALGWGWSKAFHPDDLGRITDYWQSHIMSGDAGEIEARLRQYDGSYRWFLIRGEALRDQTGAIVKWYGTNTDIHDRKLAEEQVLRSEAFLAEAQRLARVGSFSWRVVASEIKWSEQLYRIFEFDPEIPISVDLIRSRIHPEDLSLFDDMIERAGRAVTDLEYELRIQTANGGVKYLHLVADASRDHEGQLEYIGAVQDVTQRHLAEAALDKARVELAKVTRITTLGALTASIAHEVNQPLSGIVTNASTCLKMLNCAPPNIDGARETVRRTIRDGNRASEVVTHLRTLFGKKEVSAEPLDLNEATREVIALLLSDLQGQRVVLELDFAEPLPPLKGDRIQLQQVVLNLVRNASEAMNGIADRPKRLLIRTQHEGGDVRLTVQDSGIGLAAKDAERLFESFYTTKPDGMGIGLSISRSIIEAHHGRLWAMRNDGPGCTFAFSIPCAPPS
jgi:PAS domain S-box-containing protein